MSGRFAAIILAAGLSSRLADPALPHGGFKPLLPLDGETLLGRAVALFRAAGVDEILVVTGHRAAEVQAEAERLALSCIHNPEFAHGMFSSVRAGLAALPHGLDGTFVLPVDIPLVRPTTLRRLQAAFSGQPALVPEFFGEAGHPPLIAAWAAPFILGWNGEEGLRGALAALCAFTGCPGGPPRVPVPDAGVLFDLDRPKDYREALRRWARRGVPTAEETAALLDVYKVAPRGRAHGRAVADAALALARALTNAETPLDVELLESAALLHDIAKGRPGHEMEGGRLLDADGFFEAARIVAAHRDIRPEDAPRLGERELVYFADKLIRCDRFVGVAARFQEKLDAFAADAQAVRAITRRKENALHMQARIEVAAGRDISEILAASGIETKDAPCR